MGSSLGLGKYYQDMSKNFYKSNLGYRNFFKLINFLNLKIFFSTLIFGLVSKSEVRISKFEKLINFLNFLNFFQYHYFLSSFQIRGQNFKIGKINKFFRFLKFLKFFFNTLIFGLVSKFEVRISKFEKLINFLNF